MFRKDSAKCEARVGDKKSSIPGLPRLTRYCGMSNTSNLQLPYLAVGQAQKHVTVNESLRRLDALVQLSVISATTSVEPGAPSDGQVWIVPSGKSGATWNSFANWSLGYYRDGAWVQITPREGWIAYVQDADEARVYTGAAWVNLCAAIRFTASDKLLGRASSGDGAAEEITCTAAGRALIDDADARHQCATLGTWRVLAASAVAVSHTGSTSETTLATVSVPAGAIGANGALRVTMVWSYTNSANAKTARMRLGGTSFLVFNATTTSSARIEHQIHNVNSEGAQKGWVNNGTAFGSSTGTIVTASIDTTVAQDITFRGGLANAGETITLESYLVELFHQA